MTLYNAEASASVAQRQSSGFVNSRFPSANVRQCSIEIEAAHKLTEQWRTVATVSGNV